MNLTIELMPPPSMQMQMGGVLSKQHGMLRVSEDALRPLMDHLWGEGVAALGGGIHVSFLADGLLLLALLRKGGGHLICAGLPKGIRDTLLCAIAKERQLSPTVYPNHLMEELASIASQVYARRRLWDEHNSPYNQRTWLSLQPLPAVAKAAE